MIHDSGYSTATACTVFIRFIDHLFNIEPALSKAGAVTDTK